MIPKEKRILNFFSHPTVGIAGSIASVIALSLALFFWITEPSKPKLTFFSHPARGIIFRADEASGLKISKNGINIENNISTAQVAFWNQGEQPIEKNDILLPLTITIENNIAVLEARIIKSSREVTAIRINESEASKGVIKIDWNILESGDGANIQIMYAGSTDNKIFVKGAIKGQREINEIIYPLKIDSPHEQFFEKLESERRKTKLLISLGLLAMVASFYLRDYGKMRIPIIKERNKDLLFPNIHILFNGMYILTSFVAFFLGLYSFSIGLMQLAASPNVEPPFGF